MNAEVAKFEGLPDVAGVHFQHDGHDFEVKADRIVRDGKEVAVLVSPGFGSGFITTNRCISPFEPKLVALVLAGKQDALRQVDEVALAEWLGLSEDDFLYLGGASDLIIQYVPLGVGFAIEEYDGAESLRLYNVPPFVA